MRYLEAEDAQAIIDATLPQLANVLNGQSFDISESVIVITKGLLFQCQSEDGRLYYLPVEVTGRPWNVSLYDATKVTDFLAAHGLNLCEAESNQIRAVIFSDECFFCGLFGVSPFPDCQ